MKTSLVAGLLAFSLVSSTSPVWGNEEPPEAVTSVMSIIASEGVFAFTDGSSVYRLYADHRFELVPVGISGRSIEGVWTENGGDVLVTGRWGWENGLSVENDYRELSLHLSYSGEPAEVVGYRGERVYPLYFTIERLVPIDETTYQGRIDAALAAASLDSDAGQPADPSDR